MKEFQLDREIFVQCSQFWLHWQRPEWFTCSEYTEYILGILKTFNFYAPTAKLSYVQFGMDMIISIMEMYLWLPSVRDHTVSKCLNDFAEYDHLEDHLNILTIYTQLLYIRRVKMQKMRILAEIIAVNTVWHL